MLYTRKGDGGETRAFAAGAAKISKSSELPEALGTLDELNSFIGLCRAKARSAQDPLITLKKKQLSISGILYEVQQVLFILQAEVAGAPKSVPKTKVLRTEAITDAIEKEIPPLKGFSIAGGTELSAMLDVARTLARRAERRLVGLHEKGVRKLSEHSRQYANRLSSLLFALARLANDAAGVVEETPSYK